jgi:hypothetical protein
VEVACDYTDDCVESITFNPLVAAAKLSHDQHRPLVLSPDVIWLTLCQGLSLHVEEQWAMHRDSILVHKRNPNYPIEVSTIEFPFGSPETPWDSLVSDACSQVKRYIQPEFASLFNADFSTSQNVDQVALEIALLAAVSNEFPIIDSSSVCGIPTVTLTGTPDDWRMISDRLEIFSNYGLSWWVCEIRGILKEFYAASKGNVDRGFWEQLYSVGDCLCGPDDRVTGWIGKLFPYLQSPYDGRSKNRLVTHAPGDYPTVDQFPIGLRGGKVRSQRNTIVHLVGGLMGFPKIQRHGD